MARIKRNEATYQTHAGSKPLRSAVPPPAAAAAALAGADAATVAATVVASMDARASAAPVRASAAPVRAKRYRPGLKARAEIRKHQRSTGLVVRKWNFQCLVRQVAGDVAKGMRFQTHAIMALHEAVEAYATSILADANVCTHLDQRVTVMRKDLQLSRRIRGEHV